MALHDRVLWALLGITVAAFAGTAVLAGLLFYFFNPAGAGDCSFNISVISLTLALGLLVSAVSMSPYVRGLCASVWLTPLHCIYICIAPGVCCAGELVSKEYTHFPSCASVLALACLSPTSP